MRDAGCIVERLRRRIEHFVTNGTGTHERAVTRKRTWASGQAMS